MEVEKGKEKSFVSLENSSLKEILTVIVVVVVLVVVRRNDF